jgi:hypothetical protein
MPPPIFLPGRSIPVLQTSLKFKVPRLTRTPGVRETPPDAPSAESCIRKAVVERGFTPGLVGLADANAEDEAALRWADCAVAYGD